MDRRGSLILLWVFLAALGCNNPPPVHDDRVISARPARSPQMWTEETAEPGRVFYDVAVCPLDSASEILDEAHFTHMTLDEAHARYLAQHPEYKTNRILVEGSNCP